MEISELERTAEDLKKIKEGRRVAAELLQKKYSPDGASTKKTARQKQSGETRVPALDLGAEPHATPDQATLPGAVNQRGDVHLRLPFYSGAVKPYAFFAQVELAADLAGWSPAEIAVRVALSLEGDALRVLEDLRAEERKDWAKLWESLHFRFGAGDRKEAAGEELAVRERRVSEPLGAFAMDLRCLARRGYPEFEHDQQEELARRAFLRGFRPLRLREHLRLAAPRSLAEALREAERTEPILVGHRGERAELLPVARGRSVGEPSRGQGYPSRLGREQDHEVLRRRRGPGLQDYGSNVPRREDNVPQQLLN